MVKKFKLILTVLALMTALVFVGCKDATMIPADEGTGSIDFNVTGNVSRAIVPDIDMGISTITIKGVSQDYPSANFEFDYDYDSESAGVQTSLYVGKWDISLEAFNVDGDLIGSDSTTVNVWINQTVTASFVIVPIEGAERLRLKVTDVLEDLEERNLPNPQDVYIAGSYTKLNGETENFRIILDEGVYGHFETTILDFGWFSWEQPVYVVDGTEYNGYLATGHNGEMHFLPALLGEAFDYNAIFPELETGWYNLDLRILIGDVYEEDNSSHIELSDSIVTTFRIVNSVTTDAELTITADETYLGANGLSVEVEMENMINVGLQSDGETITAVTVDAETGEVVDALITWYVNGDVAGNGNTLDIDFETAGYDLDGWRFGVNKVTAVAEYRSGLGDSFILVTIPE